MGYERAPFVSQRRVINEMVGTAQGMRGVDHRMVSQVEVTAFLLDSNRALRSHSGGRNGPNSAYS